MPPVSEAKEGDEKSILTLIDRRQAAVSASAVHSNNKLNPRALMQVLGAFALVAGFIWFIVSSTGAKPARVVAAPTVVASLTPVPSVIYGGSLFLPTGSPLPLPSAAPSLPPSSTPLPTNTLRPSTTPTITGNVLLSVKSFWPKTGSWGVSQTRSGVDPVLLDGLGGACPEVWPLGTYLEFQNGRRFLCADRAALTCTGGICPVVLYSSDRDAIKGVYGARVVLPPVLFAASGAGSAR